MSDVHKPEIRSYNMSRIKGKNTRPEILVRRALHAKGFRFRLHCSELPGKPDIVLPKYKIAIQVHGCFWHGHEGCRYFKLPGTRTGWWLDKINNNKRRDVENEALLNAFRWEVLIIFECELKPSKREQTLNQIINKLNKCKNEK